MQVCIPTQVAMAGDSEQAWDAATSCSDEVVSTSVALPSSRGVSLPQAKRRGRPKGSYGAPALRAHLRNVIPAAREEEVAARATKISAVSGASEMGEFLRIHLGAECHALCLSACNRPAQEEELGDTSGAFIDHFMSGETHRYVGSNVIEASMVSFPRTHLPEEVQALASFVHFACRGWAASLFSHLLTEISSQEVAPISAIWTFMSDETSLPLTAQIWTSQRMSPDEASWQHVPGRRRAEKVEQDAAVKIIQSEFSVCLLFRVVKTQRLVAWHIPFPCPLQCADHASAETLLAAWREVVATPLWEDVRQAFLGGIALLTLDRASSNIKAARAWKAIAPPGPGHLQLRLPCEAHICHTVCGRTYAPVDSTISGVIAFTLALKPGGALTLFKRELQSVLLASVRLVTAPAPDDNHPWSLRRDALLNLTLPLDSLVGLSRKAALRRLLTSDIRQEHIEWYNPAGATAGEISRWASEVAENLMPCAPATFSRTRWLGSVQPVAEVTLLACTHNLAARTIVRFYRAMAGKPLPQVSIATAWTVESDASDMDADPGDDHAENEPFPADQSKWSEWNRQQRRDARRWQFGVP